ncbi:MAG: glucose-1-phosphate adenylyltransferase subunit GlgD [Clostridia bacterium]|nr:glucose-1-phosphate adenylyltransferase subunit GlgD [Clostridia bacterium]
MIHDTFALIYTGDTTPLLRELTLSRSVAAVPFGGRYRCIDFVLSNIVNSGIDNVGVIMQKNYHSLMDHLGSGKEWDLNRKHDGMFILPPFMTKDNAGVFRGDIDAIHAVMTYIRRSTQKYVLLTGSHTIFNTTFEDMLKKHVETGADITIMYNIDPKFNPEDQNRDLRLIMREDSRVTEMEWNPYRPRTNARSCDAMIMEKKLLEYLIEEAYARGDSDFTRDILQRLCGTLKIYGWRYDGYVARLDSINTYYKCSMDMLNVNYARDLYNHEHPVVTKVKDQVSAKYGPNSDVSNAMLADGCVIDGAVSDSILFRGVTVAEGAKVTNSILLQGTTVGAGAVLDHVICDKNCVIRPGRSLIGYENFPIVLKKGATV